MSKKGRQFLRRRNQGWHDTAELATKKGRHVFQEKKRGDSVCISSHYTTGCRPTWRRTANSLLSPDVANCVRRTSTRVKFGEPKHGSVDSELSLEQFRGSLRHIFTKSRSLTAAAPSDSVFRALGTNWLTYLLTYLLTYSVAAPGVTHPSDATESAPNVDSLCGFLSVSIEQRHKCVPDLFAVITQYWHCNVSSFYC